MKSAPDIPEGKKPVHQEIAGERAVPVIAQALSLQTKFSNYMAFGLISFIGVGLLLWYYSRTPTHGKAQFREQQHAVSRTATDDVLLLPSLGPIRIPVTATSLFDDSGHRRAEGNIDSLGSKVRAVGPAPAVDLGSKVVNASPLPETSGSVSRTPPSATGVRSSFQRRVSGEAFVAVGPATGGSPAGPASTSTEQLTSQGPLAPEALPVAPRAEGDALVSLLSHVPTRVEVAGTRPIPALLLQKGTFIDCTLETAIDSTLPGMTTCITATDTFSADGTVVLFGRGTRVIGETRGQVQQGQARVFVLWTEARTPEGIVVPLDSPGADELGRSGLPGQVDHHFWQRFGAAMLLTVIDGAVQSGVQAASSGRGGTVIYNPGSAQDVMSEVLKGTVATPPTITKSNGDRIQIFVARDVDFRDVYELEPTRSYH